MLNHSPIQHSCGNIPPTTFLLQFIQALEDDAFPVGETVSHIRQIVIRATFVHGGSTVIKENVNWVRCGYRTGHHACYGWRCSNACDVSISHGTETCSCVIIHRPSIFRNPTVTRTQVSVCSPVVVVLRTRLRL